jgi:hypothetical protein
MKVARAITIGLLIAALFSAGSIVLSAQNYIQGISATKSVHLRLSNLALSEKDKTQVRITFHAVNRSDIDVQLDAFRFKLHLNDRFLGTHHFPLTRKLLLKSVDETSASFVLPIQSFYFQYIEQARQEKDFSWLVQGEVRLVLLPFNENEVWLDINEYWSGRQ